MLSADKLMADAKAKSGLDDFGNMDFVEGLTILVDSINAEAHLAPENEILFGQHLVRILMNRLRMQRDLKRHPEILDEEILPPVFITSLPRTGSTKLHRMLAATGDFNAMQFWQGYDFARYSSDADNNGSGPDPRIAVTEKRLEWMFQRSPLLQAAHPVYANDAEEEYVLLDAGFNSLYGHASFVHVPSYMEWVLKLDPRQGYRDVRRILQYLQWQHYRGHRRRWLLKTPALLGMESYYADVFPGMDFIVTHRQPDKIIASVCALLVAYLKIHNDFEYTGAVGEMMMHSFGLQAEAHLKWRDEYPAKKVIDVRFDDVVNDEASLLPKIYEFFGMPFTQTARANVDAWLAMDARRRLTPTHFSLAEYGLDAAKVSEKFAGYLQRYKEFL